MNEGFDYGNEGTVLDLSEYDELYHSDLYRPSAIRRYAARREEAVSLEPIQARIFLLLWIYFFSLLALVVAVWCHDTPEHAYGTVFITHAQRQSEAAHFLLVIHSEDVPRLKIGDRVFFVTAASSVASAEITSIEPTIMSLQQLTDRLDMHGHIMQDIAHSTMAIAELGQVANTTGDAIERDMAHSAQIELGSSRVIDLVPWLGPGRRRTDGLR
jgi:hypothetical protein